MSSLGKTYAVYIEPYAAGTLCPVNVRAFADNANMFTNVGSTEIRIATVGVGGYLPVEPQIFDARRRAGLVNLQEAARKQASVANYMDVGFTDGKPFQSRHVIVVMIPTSIRTGLYQAYFDFGINSIDISAAVKSLVDAYYIANNTYNTELMGLTPSQLLEANRYVSFIFSCNNSAHQKVIETVKKYVAAGSYPVVVYK